MSPPRSPAPPPRNRAPSFILGLVCGAALIYAAGLAPQPKPQQSAEPAAPVTAAPAVWSCSMHPQIKLPGPGRCPSCSMDLIPLEPASIDAGGAALTLSPEAAALAAIETTRVERRFIAKTLRFVGRVTYDETRVRTITAWASGRLERLFVDYTGLRVRRGDHLVSLYSPELIAAQEELLEAKKVLAPLGQSDSATLRETARATVTAAREKLRLLGLTQAQIEQIEETGEARETVTIYAPSGGVVIHKSAEQGRYVKTGSPLYQIADLEKLWVSLDAYEADLAWLRFGQTLSIEVEAHPGQRFEGQLSFIAPVLDEQTRTFKLRVNLANPDGLLKPGMFVRARLSARLGAEGPVPERSLAGKWISPMHPEVIKDVPGDCDVCGMDLVPAATLGHGVEATGATPPLVIPRSAALVTGARSVAYVQSSADPTRYEGRELTLGAQGDDHIIVLAGLKAGERVVTRGAFKIDSALQIQAKPSLMSPVTPTAPGSGLLPAPARDALSSQLGPLLEATLAAQRALAADDGAAAARAGAALEASIAALTAPADARAFLTALGTPAGELRKSAELAHQRRALGALNASLIALLGSAAPRPLLTVHCPMAFEEAGGSWLQEPGPIANPYFGARMLRCGEVTAKLGPTESAAASPTTATPGEAPSTRPTNATPRAASDAHAATPPPLALYLKLQEALAGDAEAASFEAAASLAKQLAKSAHQRERQASRALTAARGIEALRRAFAALSEALLERPGFGANTAVSVVRCAMALDGEGARWLQAKGPIANPYFGARMLRCGTPQQSSGAAPR